MKLGSIHRRICRFRPLALIGGSGAVFAVIAGCKPEVVNIAADALEGGFLAGIPSFFEWLRQDTEDVESIPTVLLDTFNAISTMLT